MIGRHTDEERHREPLSHEVTEALSGHGWVALGYANKGGYHQLSLTLGFERTDPIPRVTRGIRSSSLGQAHYGHQASVFFCLFSFFPLSFFPWARPITVQLRFTISFLSLYFIFFSSFFFLFMFFFCFLFCLSYFLFLFHSFILNKYLCCVKISSFSYFK